MTSINIRQVSGVAESETSYIINSMVEFISFSPTRSEREKLYEQSIAAQKQSDEYRGIESPKDLITKNKASKDTGYTTTVFATKKEFAFYKDSEFCIFNTQNFQLIGGSMGSNCTPFVPESINLFNRDEKTTREFLGRFMKWRKRNELNIFAAYVHSLGQFENPEKKQVFEQSLLSRNREDLEVDINVYRNVTYMFQKILSTLDENSDLASHGINFKSFCQTWMKKGKVGKASFSVPSPHFQTFPYLDLSMYNDLPIELINDYNRLLRVQAYDMTTKIVDGELEYEKSFVDLDNMWKKMNEKNIFFVNSAPCLDTLSRMIKARDSLTDGDFSVVFTASLLTYINAVDILNKSKDSGHIGLLPSNFRTTIKPGAKIDGIDCTQENYLLIQENISRALMNIISWCKQENINVFFASTPRDCRPIYIASASASTYTGRSKYLNYDPDLTSKVVDELLIPALADRMNTEPSTCLVDKALDNFTEHKATFLSDVLSVAVSSEMLDDETAWISYDLLEEPEVVNKDKLIYLSAKFTIGQGTFKSPSLSGQAKCRDAMLKVLGRTQPVWKSCYIIHDEFLNDIDDVPANYLANILTEKGGLHLYKNYN